MRMLLVLSLAFATACSNNIEVVDVTKGDKGDKGDAGTSCTVAPEYAPYFELFTETSNEVLNVIGARISCTDGTWALVLNGENGAQGVQGPQGEQGIQGPQGEAAQSCQVYRAWHGAYLYCPGQYPVLIKDGKDGKDGQDGEDGNSCYVTQLNNGAKITCGYSKAYIYNGINGTNGTSCTVVRENSYDRAKITCGSNIVYVYDGLDGEDGENGDNAFASVQTFSPGTSCIQIGSNASAKRDGSSDNVKLYSGTSCSGTAFNMGDGDSAMTSINQLVIKVQDAAVLKLITFN